MTDKTPGFQHAIEGTARRLDRCTITTHIDGHAFPGNLTPRQANILKDRINGHSWRTIANAYHITEATARGHHKAALNAIERARKATT